MVYGQSANRLGKPRSPGHPYQVPKTCSASLSDTRKALSGVGRSDLATHETQSNTSGLERGGGVPPLADSGGGLWSHKGIREMAEATASPEAGRA